MLDKRNFRIPTALLIPSLSSTLSLAVSRSTVSNPNINVVSGMPFQLQTVLDAVLAMTVNMKAIEEITSTTGRTTHG